ncbi:hypothetical protein ETI06_00200 [Macrococcoides goetzii]|nr:restriction endonuclease subunit S [Macrococcus goetzii]TDM50432.1 hypothetical protein ETI06_00200 [Macrococcus goetzii]
MSNIQNDFVNEKANDENWSVTPLKYLAKVQTGNTPKNNKEDLFVNSDGLEWIKTDNLNFNNCITKAKQQINRKYISEARIAQQGNILVSCIGDIGKIGYANKEVAYNQQINAVIFNNQIYWKFGLYFLMCQKEQHEYFSHGNVLKILNTENQKKVKIKHPKDIKLQKDIVNKLDAIIEKVDSIIIQTKQSIDELKKYKQSLIIEVVTKGLDKNVEMKDSGIEWIGEIPKDWSIVKINKVAKIKNGKEVSTETGVIPVYGSGGVFKYTDDFLYEGESVLFGRKGTIGKPIYTNSKIWTVDTMFYTEIKNTIIAKLFYYFLTAFPWSIYETKTALPSIVGGEIEQSKILLPNKKTQQEIVNYLDEKTEAIDNIVESKYILIREYESYKKSLIYEYVTGKKEVGEEVE